MLPTEEMATTKAKEASLAIDEGLGRFSKWRAEKAAELEAWVDEVRGAQVVAAPGEQPPAKALTAEDMELTGSIITYAGLSEDFQQLVDEALMRRDRARMLNGQPKYGSVEGMIDAYEELGKPKGWTRVEAESEVVRYLQRQALRDEGGLDGSAQDTPTFVLLGLVVASAIYGAAAW